MRRREGKKGKKSAYIKQRHLAGKTFFTGKRDSSPYVVIYHKNVKNIIFNCNSNRNHYNLYFEIY